MTTRLRDSCETCGGAKVKCSKDKPTCLRCRERGIVCEYGASRRTGRTAPRGPYGSNKNRASKGCDLAGEMQTAKSMPSPGQARKHGTLINTFDDPDMMDLTQNNYDSATGMDAMDLGHSNWDFMTNPTPDMDRSMSCVFSHSAEPTMFPMADDGMDSWQLYPGHTSAGSWDMPHNTHQTEAICHKPESCCLVDALELLRRLSVPDTPQACSRRNHTNPGPSKLSSFQALAPISKATLSALSNILNCCCSSNGNLLTLMFLIALKLVACYAAVAVDARRSGSSESSDDDNSDADNLQSPFTANGLLGDLPSGFGHLFSARKNQQDKHGRVTTAQEILNELYRIQDVGKRISQRVNEARRSGGLASMKSSKSPRAHPDFSSAISSTAPLLTEEISNHYATNLNQRLRQVSFLVIRILVQN